MMAVALRPGTTYRLMSYLRDQVNHFHGGAPPASHEEEDVS